MLSLMQHSRADQREYCSVYVWYVLMIEQHEFTGPESYSSLCFMGLQNESNCGLN